jgi:hypothetical protein
MLRFSSKNAYSNLIGLRWDRQTLHCMPYRATSISFWKFVKGKNVLVFRWKNNVDVKISLLSLSGAELQKM